ncbi:MAG TPA: hypothetical protein VEP94_00530, partial [Solirubrobacterales bacterium]|nr:hypothetical protein [Solirubrobacterales bacterium]
MKRLERLVAALTPKRWPVRWRLAAVSAALTFLILVIFALVVGRLTSNRLHGDFNDDVQGTALTFGQQTRVRVNPLTGSRFVTVRPPVQSMAIPPNSVLRIVNQDGSVVPGQSSEQAVDLGAPAVGTVGTAGKYAVA